MLRQRKLASEQRLHKGPRPAWSNGLTAIFVMVGTVGLSLGLVLCLICGCAMSEEVRRIQRTKQAEQMQEASLSSNLTGEQIFIRSCNTCHPAGKKGLGPTLEDLSEKYPEDQLLKALIRHGKGTMPAQPKETLNDQELNNLVLYLRHLTSRE